MAAALLLGGCASEATRDGDPTPGQPLAFSVGVYFDDAASSLPAPEASEASPDRPPADGPTDGSTDGSTGTAAEDPARIAHARLLARSDEFLDTVIDALVGSEPVVQTARLLSASSRDEALTAARESHLDLLMAVSVKAPSRFGEVERPVPMAILEVVCWLCGGVPAWFTPSVSYPTDTRLTVEVIDLNRTGADPGRIRHPVSSESDAVSLWERADITEEPLLYLLSIVIPPMLILPDDKRLTSESVTTDVLVELRDDLCSSLRERLLDQERGAPLRLRVVTPSPADGPAPGDADVRLAIASRENRPLKALDIHRLATDAAKVRYVAPRASLAEWNERLASAPSGSPVEIDTGWRVPLAPGANVIKVRALRADGERTSRTVIIRCEETR